MFNAYEFTFAGESSAMYGLMIYDFGGVGQTDVSFGNQASIVEMRTNSRIQPIHFGVNYNGTPLQFKLVFGAERPLDRYEMQDVALWLTGHQQYQWMSIDQSDLDRIEFKCLITQLTPLTHGWLPYAFEATVVCDCPYGYGPEWTMQYHIDGETEILFRNESSVREYIKPIVRYDTQSLARTSGFEIVNHSDNDRSFRFETIPDSITSVTVDNENRIISCSENGYNLYDSFNMNFFRLVHGDNYLTVRGNGTLTISGRFLFNVAG